MNTAVAPRKAGLAGKPLPVMTDSLGFAERHHIKWVDHDLREKTIDKDVLKTIRSHFAREHNVLPVTYRKMTNTLTVVAGSKEIFRVLDDIRLLSECEVEVQMGEPEMVRAAVSHFYNIQDTDLGAMMAGDFGDFEIVSEQEVMSRDEQRRLEQMASDKPLVKYLDSIIYDAVQKRASDVHFVPEENRMRVKFRIDGRLREQDFVITEALKISVATRFKIMCALNITEKRTTQGGRAKLRLKGSGKEVELRVSFLPTNYGESIVIRIHDRTALNVSIYQIGFRRDFLDLWQQAITASRGLVLVTGAVGSGKSTTLYASLAQMVAHYHGEKKIMSIEDPVERDVKGVQQCPVSPKVTYVEALRTALRQDPNVLMVGEVRDKDTAEVVVSAAYTGHLVLSTLHTHSSIGAVNRMFELGADRSLLVDVLLGVVAQTLVPKNCPHCREPYQPDLTKLRLSPEHIKLLKGINFQRSTGCKKCDDSGILDRLPVYEFLVMDRQLRQMFLDRQPEGAIEEYLKTTKFTNMFESGIVPLRDGDITIEALIEATSKEILVVQ